MYSFDSSPPFLPHSSSLSIILLFLFLFFLSSCFYSSPLLVSAFHNHLNKRSVFYNLQKNTGDRQVVEFICISSEFGTTRMEVLPWIWTFGLFHPQFSDLHISSKKKQEEHRASKQFLPGRQALLWVQRRSWRGCSIYLTFWLHALLSNFHYWRIEPHHHCLNIHDFFIYKLFVILLVSFLSFNHASLCTI